MWVEIVIAVIALLGSGALGGYLSWFFFYKDRRKAFIARVRKETTMDKAEEYKAHKSHMEQIEKDVEELRKGLYAEKTVRLEVEQKMNTYQIELDTHRKHMGVLFKLCRCKNTPEVKLIREFYEAWFNEGLEEPGKDAEAPQGPDTV